MPGSNFIKESFALPLLKDLASNVKEGIATNRKTNAGLGIIYQVWRYFQEIFS